MKYVRRPQSSPALEILYPSSFSEENYLLLPVQAGNVDTTPVNSYAAEQGFTPKAEYHLTIIGSKKTAAAVSILLKSAQPERRRNLKTAINNLIPLLGPARILPGQYLHLIKDYVNNAEPEIRESVIQEVAMDGMDDFYAEFSRITGIGLGTPYPHLTLFTKGTGRYSARGIGIASAEALESIEHHRIEI